MNRLRLGLITAGFLGCSPVAPGTFGTLAGVPLAWLLRDATPYPVFVLGLAALLYAVGRALGPWTEENYGKDPGRFVLDEVIGYLITVCWIDAPSLMALALAFLLFRVFDILKPWPVRAMERIPGADGILLDDVVAGLYGLACMAVLRLLLPGEGLWVYNGA